MKENNYRKLSRREQEINQMVHEQQLWKRELKHNREIAEQKIAKVLEHCQLSLGLPSTALAKVNTQLRSGLITPQDFNNSNIPFSIR